MIRKKLMCQLFLFSLWALETSVKTKQGFHPLMLFHLFN